MREHRILVADLMVADPDYAGKYVFVFERLDREILQAESLAFGDVLERARQLASIMVRPTPTTSELSKRPKPHRAPIAESEAIE